jgi:hypothetical protein
MDRQPRRRRRPALSCQVCRRRKIKCDHNEPCSNCLRHKAQCVYTPHGHSKVDGLSAVSQSHIVPAPQSSHAREEATTAEAGRILPPQRAILQQTTPSVAVTANKDISTAENGVAGGDGRVHIDRPQITTATQVIYVDDLPVGNKPGRSLPKTSHGVVSKVADENVTELLERVRKLEDSSASHGEARTSDPSLQVLLDKPRDLGKRRMMGKPREFSVMISCYSEIVGKDSGRAAYRTPETASLVAQCGALIRECKDAAKNIKASRPSRSRGSPHEIGIPHRDVSDAMTNLYFSFFESTHRILHGPSFRKEYERYWDHPDNAPPELRLKILLVIGLGSSLHDHKSMADALSNADVVHGWICAAQSWLSGPLEKDRLTIDGLQIYCLTLLARQIFSVGGDLTWISTGSLVQTAMQMGLHRDPGHLAAIAPLQAEIRRRLWATILELVVQSSLDSWMPPRICLDEFDIKAPSNLNDEDLDEATTAAAIHPQPDDVFTGTSIQLTLLQSIPLRLRIVQLLNSLHSEHSYPAVLELSLALTEALHTCASRTDKQDSEHCNPFRRNLLDYLTRRFLLPLHMSFSSRAGAEPVFRHSRQASLDAALAILSPDDRDGGDGDDGRFARLMALAGGMFREGQRCALTAVGMELIAHAEAQRLDGTLGRAGAYRGVLKGAVRDLLSLAERRVRLGETNVKSHMFLSMVLAQAEAVEAGTPVELQVARGARDSLELCCGILRARAGSIQVPSAMPADAGTEAAGVGGHGMEDYSMYGMCVGFDWDSIMSDIDFS